MTAIDIIQEAYATGLQAALDRKEQDDTQTIVEAARTRINGIEHQLKELGIINNVSLFQSNKSAFLAGYNDAIVMRNNTEQYKILASFDKTEQKVFCDLLAYAWMSTRQYLNLNFDTGLLDGAYSQAQDKEQSTHLQIVGKDNSNSKALRLSEGVSRLLANDDTCIDDLVAPGRVLQNVDISFSIIPAPTLDRSAEALSIIITPDYEETDETIWHFSSTFYPNEGESIKDLAARIAKNLDIEPNEQVWIDAQAELDEKAE